MRERNWSDSVLFLGSRVEAAEDNEEPIDLLRLVARSSVPEQFLAPAVAAVWSGIGVIKGVDDDLDFGGNGSSYQTICGSCRPHQKDEDRRLLWTPRPLSGRRG